MSSVETTDEDGSVIVHRGVYDKYYWLTAAGDVYFGTLLSACPDVVVDRFLAVTSHDSGVYPLRPGDSEKGWSLDGRISYSPRVSTVEEINFQRDGSDTPGFDEWYVFSEPRRLGPTFQGNFLKFDPATGKVVVHVNLFAFALHDTSQTLAPILECFWQQLMTISPESFIADCRRCLTVVSRRKDLIDRWSHLAANETLDRGAVRY